MGNMLNLGIVGCGRVTRMFHINAIEEITEVNIAAISDLNVNSMIETQKICSIPNAYEDFSLLLEDETVDAVAINTPPRFHEEMVIEALDAGKHVICEKPLSTTIEGCKRIREKRDKTGLIVFPAHNYSFTPGLLMMENLISENQIGKVSGMRIVFENNLKQYRADTDFRTKNKYGLIEDVLPHILSVVHPVLGYCTGVEDVNWWCKTYEVCDNMEVTLNTVSEISVECSMSWTKLVPVFEVEIIGEEGSLTGEFSLNPYTVELQKSGVKEIHKEKGLSWYLDLIRFKHPSFQNQYKHFHDLIINKCTPRVTINDEINILESIETLSGYME